jgi:hypothetical protein
MLALATKRRLGKNGTGIRRVEMANAKRCFEGVSPGVWQRMQTRGEREHGTVFQHADAARGTATTPTPIGPVVLDFEFEPDAERITYTIVRKPMFAADSLIWGGIAIAIERCREA